MYFVCCTELYNCLHSICQQNVDEGFTEHFFDIKQQNYEFPQHF